MYSAAISWRQRIFGCTRNRTIPYLTLSSLNVCWSNCVYPHIKGFECGKFNAMILGSRVGIATDYGQEDLVSLPGSVKTVSLGPNYPLVRWVPGALFPEVTGQECEADHSSPSSGEVKNCGAIRPLPHLFSWNSA
jgi:hypothetical protein